MTELTTGETLGLGIKANKVADKAAPSTALLVKSCLRCIHTSCTGKSYQTLECCTDFKLVFGNKLVKMSLLGCHCKQWTKLCQDSIALLVILMKLNQCDTGQGLHQKIQMPPMAVIGN